MSRNATSYFFLMSLLATLGLAINHVNAMPPPPNKLDQQKAALAKTDSSSFDSFKLSKAFDLRTTASLSTPIKVYLTPVELNFQKRWLREHRTELTQSYLTNTAERYQSVFDNAIQQEFSKHSDFEIVEDQSNASLIIVPTLSDLIIHGPDVGPGKTSYVQRAGEAKLSVEVQDASESVIATIEDRRQTRQRAMIKPEKTSRIFNQRDFRYLFDDWSEDLARELGKKLKNN